MKPRGLLATTWTLARKDLAISFRDPVGVLLGFALPLLLVAVFGFVMGNVGGGDGAMPKVEIAVLDLDDSGASRALLAALRASDALRVREASAETPWTAEDLTARVRDGEEPLALLIPKGYGAGADLTLLQDPGRALERQLVGIGLMQALLAAEGQDAGWRMTRRALVRLGLPEAFAERIDATTNMFRGAVETLFEEAQSLGLIAPDAPVPPVDAGADTSAAAPAPEPGPDFGQVMMDMLPVQRLDVEPEGRDKQISYQVSHAVSGMTVMMLLFSLMGFARSMIEERDKGALRRLFASPIDRRAVLLSKFVVTLVMGGLLVVVLFGFAAIAFRLDVLSRLDTLAVAALLTCFTSAAFALLIASWAKTDKQADGLSTMLILVMASVGGCWVPLMLLPEAVQFAAQFTLPYWSMSAFQGSFWYGRHWTDPAMLLPLGVQLAIGLALLVVAIAVFRRRYLDG